MSSTPLRFEGLTPDDAPSSFEDGFGSVDETQTERASREECRHGMGDGLQVAEAQARTNRFHRRALRCFPDRVRQGERSALLIDLADGAYGVAALLESLEGDYFEAVEWAALCRKSGVSSEAWESKAAYLHSVIKLVRRVLTRLRLGEITPAQALIDLARGVERLDVEDFRPRSPTPSGEPPPFSVRLLFRSPHRPRPPTSSAPLRTAA